MSKKSDDYYDKKIDNELKKKEISEKYGGEFGGGKEVPLEVETDWLNYIEEFEKQFENRKYISVWEYLGKPEYNKVSELNEGEIYDELDRLFGLMHENNIHLDTLAGVEDEELYRFITEDLFVYEMNDIRIEGMNHNFIYEEFYPNAELDIKQAIDHFLDGSMGKFKKIGGEGYDLLFVDLENYINGRGEPVKKEDVERRINNFLDSFDTFEIDSYDVKSFYVNKDETDAEVCFSISYKGLFVNDRIGTEFTGNGCFKLKPSPYGGWGIYNIDLPGLNVE